MGYPTASVTVPVQAGLFSVLVGGSPMTLIDPNVIAGFTSHQALRVWVDLTGTEYLLGDVPLSSVLFAHSSHYARASNGSFTATGLVYSTTGGFKFPDGTIQTTAAAGGGGGGTLDNAYDFGGSGLGRVVFADAGPISVIGSDGMWLEDNLSIGDYAPLAPLQVSANNWDLEATYGDVMVGNADYSLRIGVATGGLGAGSARLRATGGINRLSLGAGTMDVVKIDTTGLEVMEGPFKIYSDGQVNLVGDFGAGQAGVALRTENTNPGGIALWVKNNSSDATVVIGQDGTGDMVRGFLNGSLKYRVLNGGQVVTPSITITGGADLSEPFTMAEILGKVEPGSVMVIDPDNPGSLTLSGRPYDPRVAGIVSGAGGVNPGLTLSQQGVLDGGQQVALSGRVYVRVSTENGAIIPGDMITTSTIPGIGMRASDREKSFGAVVGKAMTGLDEGEGLVLVLVGLQ